MTTQAELLDIEAVTPRLDEFIERCRSAIEPLDVSPRYKTGGWGVTYTATIHIDDNLYVLPDYPDLPFGVLDDTGHFVLYSVEDFLALEVRRVGEQPSLTEKICELFELLDKVAYQLEGGLMSQR